MSRKPTPQQVLNTPMGANDASATTIRDYLGALLATLWRETDSFSAKRPFGASFWPYDLYEALGKAGHIRCVYDEDAELVEVDTDTGHELIVDAITSLINPNPARTGGDGDGCSAP